MISFLKKIVIIFITVAAVFFLVEDVLLIYKGKISSAIFVKSPPLIMRELALAKKPPIKKEPVIEKTVVTQPVKRQAIFAKSKILDVPLMNQLDPPRLYNGCEVTSLAMILNFNGYHVTKNQLANNLNTVPLIYENGLRGNPNQGFVGNMEVGPGYAVYNGPIYRLARRYAGDKAVNLTNRPFLDLLRRVSNGEPVWVITTQTFAPVSDFERWHTPEGNIDVSFSEHSVVMTGYDDHFIYINDPYGQKNKRMNRTSFEEAWEQMGKQAVVIEK